MKKAITLLLFSTILLIASAAEPSGTLPVIHIDTEGSKPIVSKEDYLQATFYLDSMGLEGIEDAGSPEEPLTLQIKGRGNYTWSSFNKKPYRLKFTSKATLLDLKANKHFALLAHADDPSFLRNAGGFCLSKLFDMEWTPEERPVELVLNGDYVGLYFLTEIIRIDKDRVNITEQAEEETDPLAITGGWLVEKDNYKEDNQVTVGNRWFTYKNPEKISREQQNYLTNQLANIFIAVADKDKDSRTWEDYLDMDQAVRYYVIQELMHSTESYHGSCYLHKEINPAQGAQEKWKFGPCWDFGSALMSDKKGHLFIDTQFSAFWIEELLKFPRFKEKCREVFQEFVDNHYDDFFEFLERRAMLTQEAVKSDAERWKGNHKVDADVYHSLATIRHRLLYNFKWVGEFLGVQVPNAGSYTWTVGYRDESSNPWPDVYVRIWHYPNNKTVDVLGKYPGAEMQRVSDHEWTLTFTTDDDFCLNYPQVSFHSEGAQQSSPGFSFINHGVYTLHGVEEWAASVPDLTEERDVKVYVDNGHIVVETETPHQTSISDLAGRTRCIYLHEGRNVLEGFSKGFYIIEGIKVML